VIYLQWKVNDQCLALWSNNNRLYKARIIEVDEQNKVCKVRYDDYDCDEERPWVALCPVYDRHLSSDDRRLSSSDRRLSNNDRRLSSDDRYHRNRDGREKREGHWQVAYI